MRKIEHQLYFTAKHNLAVILYKISAGVCSQISVIWYFDNYITSSYLKATEDPFLWENEGSMFLQKIKSGYHGSFFWSIQKYMYAIVPHDSTRFCQCTVVLKTFCDAVSTFFCNNRSFCLPWMNPAFMIRSKVVTWSWKKFWGVCREHFSIPWLMDVTSGTNALYALDSAV